MSAIFKLFLDIAFFKKGPQDVPYSLFLFGLLFAFSFVLEFLMGFIWRSRAESFGVLVYIGKLLVVVGFNLVSVYLVLLFFSKTKRFIQIITAMMGIDLLINLVLLAMKLLTTPINGGQATELSALFGMISLLLFCWYLLVYTHILRYGLSVSVLNSVMLTFLLFVAQIYFHAIMFPEPEVTQTPVEEQTKNFIPAGTRAI